MEYERVVNLIKSVIKEYYESQEINDAINENTKLFGRNSALDSMGLVNIIIDIESRFLDKGYEISLTSEKAMSRRQSPFRTVSTLAEFIEEQINTKKDSDE